MLKGNAERAGHHDQKDQSAKNVRVWGLQSNERQEAEITKTHVHAHGHT